MIDVSNVYTSENRMSRKEIIETGCNIGLFLTFWCAASWAIGVVWHTIQNLAR